MLTQTSRPKPLNNWIHTGSIWAKLPIVCPGNAEDYSISWWLWWRAMQPAWRAQTLSCDLRGTGEFNWNETRKGAENGFILVVLSVGVWFRGLEKERGKWWCGDALKEVHWVLDQMLTSGSAEAATSVLGKRAYINTSSSTVSQNKRKRSNRYVYYAQLCPLELC